MTRHGLSVESIIRQQVLRGYGSQGEDSSLLLGEDRDVTSYDTCIVQDTRQV